MNCPECGSPVSGNKCSCGWGRSQDGRSSYPNPDGEGWYVEWNEQDDMGRKTKRRQFVANCKACQILLPPFKLVREYQARNEPAGYGHKCGTTGKFYYLCSDCMAGMLGMPYAEHRRA